MDVMRTGVSVLGTVLMEAEDHNATARARHRDRLMACLGPMLAYWSTSVTTASASRSRPTKLGPAGISCACCTARAAEVVACARCTPR